MGTRKFLEDRTFEDGATLKVFQESEWLTYEQMEARSAAFGRALRKIGMEPIPQGTDLEQTTAPHTMLIFEETCATWTTALIGATGQSIAVATSYATLGVQAVVEAVNECNVSVMVLNRKDVEKVAAVAS